MEKKYEGLDFDEVKATIAKHCSFSLSQKDIVEKLPKFAYLEANRDLQRGKEALKLFQHHEAPIFAGIHDFYSVFKDIGRGKVITPQELYDVATFMGSYQNMLNYKKRIEIDAPIITDFIDSLSDHRKLKELIEKKINASYEVRDDATPELAAIRRNIRNCEQEITKKTSEIMSQYSGILMDNITATRNNRTTLLVKSADKHKMKGFIHDESASGQAVYIEPEALLVLNNRLQSLRANEKNEVEKILRELCNTLAPHTDEMAANLETLTLLDVLFAQAKWAFQKGAVYTALNKDEKHLYFKDARHPLIDDEKVVSNTYEIKEPYQHLLISGSNTGGKTVTLKTIGLFTIMSMSGFPVPCEEAVLPMFDEVYVDVGDFQSILESLSTFSAHLSKLSYILDHATSHSLVLLDELGSGTDPNEGECLAIAILDYLKKNDIMSVATTHYSKVKEYAKTQDSILLSSVGFNLETMTPTYKYMEGFSGNSNALEIAKRYHIKDEILTYAYQLKEESTTDQSLLIEKLENDRLRLLEQQDHLQKEKVQLKQEQEKLHTKEQKQQEEYERKLKEAGYKADEIIEDAREQAKTVIEELRSMKEVKEHEYIKTLSKLKVQKEEEVEDVIEEEFKVNDYVKVKGLQYQGEIISIKGNKATISTNGMRMNVKVSDLTHMTRPKKKKVASVSTSTTTARPTMECNVIGMRVSEALSVVQKYLDNAILHKMYSVTIIHGSGTGALRSAIHEFLKKQKYVKDFRLGGGYEGGVGATVVTLKGGNN